MAYSPRAKHRAIEKQLEHYASEFKGRDCYCCSQAKKEGQLVPIAIDDKRTYEEWVCEDCLKAPEEPEHFLGEPEPCNIHLEEHDDTPRVVKPTLERIAEQIIDEVMDNSCVYDACPSCEMNARTDTIDYSETRDKVMKRLSGLVIESATRARPRD